MPFPAPERLHHLGAVNACVVRGEDGEVSHYKGYTTDITARKTAEEQLKRSEQKYRELIDNINDVVFTIDLDGRITYLSPSAQHIFPDAQSLSDANFMDIVDPRDADLVRAPGMMFCRIVCRPMSTDCAWSPERRSGCAPPVARHTGTAFWSAWWGCWSEITERKLAEEYLREVLDATNDGIWDYDLVSGKFGCSNRWSQMLGYAPGEVDDFSCYCQHNIHPDDKARFSKAFRDYVEGRSSSYGIEFRLRKKCGEYIWIYSRGKALQRDPAGRALRMVGAHTDIHAQKRIEESLRESEERFRTLIESAPVSVLLVQNGRYVYGNPASARLLGYESPEP
jgi:PAS domain S-box-containing protein